ncbi:MAG: hypothetical protein ACRDZ8_16135 [Acidimicrobiales bacterium]
MTDRVIDGVKSTDATALTDAAEAAVVHGMLAPSSAPAMTTTDLFALILMRPPSCP